MTALLDLVTAWRDLVTAVGDFMAPLRGLVTAVRDLMTPVRDLVTALLDSMAGALRLEAASRALVSPDGCLETGNQCIEAAARRSLPGNFELEGARSGNVPRNRGLFDD
jgi:hypothetical protein